LANKKVINTRIQNKHELEVDWINAKNFIPLKGELIVYDKEVDENNQVITRIVEGKEVPALPDGRTTAIPHDRFKLGDGVTFVNDLPFITADAGTIYYNNETPLTTNVGGLTTGTKFDSMTINELLDKLLYPYVAPQIIGTLKMNPTADLVRKKGKADEAVIVKGAQATVVRRSKAISKIALYRDTVEKGFKYNPVIEPNTAEIAEFFTEGGSIDSENVDTDTTYYFKVFEEGNDECVAEASATYRFVDPIYCGIIGNAEEITADIIATRHNEVAQGKGTNLESYQTKGTFSYSYSTKNQKPFIAYPASYGDLSTIRDANFAYTWTRYSITINNSIEDVSYYLYVGSTSTLDATYTFTFAS
jgi:hypothetical protein